ncbi:MAG: hypothetical protein KDB90_01045 [Planctomycetes bacterium]|nr:hypothetical protein [Planctomycetota bacterium]
MLLIVACSGGLAAQFLPDINQFEVENARLILLDAGGRRVGVLSGDLARKQRDGKVHVEGAELKVVRDEGAFVMTADEFNYTPATHDFDTPTGLTATLPDGGTLTVPAGKGQIEFSDGLKLHMTVDGQAELKSDENGESPVDATIVNPVIDVAMADTRSGDKTRLGIDTISIKGTRGGELKLRLARLPALGQAGSDSPAEASVSCFGDVSLTVKDNASIAELHMLRRASMSLKDEDRSFSVTSNLLDIRGTIQQAAKKDDKPAGPPDGEPKQPKFSTVLADIAIDASQNVRLSGDEFRGTAGKLRYREFGPRREVRLETDPTLAIDQGQADDGRIASIEFRARDYIDIQIPEAEPGTPPMEISTELSASAHVRRTLGTELQWQINGRLVRLFSFLDESVKSETRYNHTFDAYAEGFSPLLRVLGIQPEQGAVKGQPVLQRAAVYGSRAEGSFISGRAKVRVYGPEVLGVVVSDAPLSDLMKIAVGLIPPMQDEEGNRIPPPSRDGLMSVRADIQLDLDMLTTVGAGYDMTLVATGNVELDHAPLPRDDSRLVSLTGETIALQTRGGAVVSAHMDALEGENALATLGYDLLICRSIDVAEFDNGLRTVMTGPGRLVVRDPSSVEYFRTQVDRLPKRPEEMEQGGKPDAGWLDFGQYFQADDQPLERTLEADSPDFRLVSGDFERPRAGRTAINDLDELKDPSVLLLYRVSALRVFASSSRSGENGTPINVLRLEGDASLDSRIDGITAHAEQAIELSGSENQRAEDAPLSVVLFKNAKLKIEDSGVFFGEYVRTGVFSYDGSWTLVASDRLEVTFRPLNAPLADASELALARKAFSRALRMNAHLLDRAYWLEQATDHLRAATRGIDRPMAPGADQPWAALDEAEQALGHIQRACIPLLTGNTGPQPVPTQALRSARRARALLAALVDVVGSGGVTGTFESSKPRVPPLTLTMLEALFTFDGLGQIVDVVAGGPIEVSRGPYTITGRRLSRQPDGTLTVSGANITLPADTGVAIEGVQSVALKQRAGGSIVGESRVERTMVTRVTGKKLTVSVKLAHNGQSK